MNYKIIAVDLDGTLFDDNKNILSETADALKKAADMGIYVIPSTGRPLSGVSENVLGLGCVEYVLTCNGAAVYDIRNKKTLFADPMPYDKSADMIAALGSLRISMDAFAEGTAYKDKAGLDIIDSLAVSEHIKSYIRNTRVYVDGLTEFIRENKMPVRKLTMNFCKDENGNYIHRDDALNILGNFDGITVVSGGEGNLEVTALGVNKGNALLKAGHILGAEKEQIIAFGDSENDIDMITAAGLGIAMGNGTAEVKAAAAFVTLSNNDNGIAYALDKFIFSE